MKAVQEIVITGGPGSGKSTARAEIASRLRDEGIGVVEVSEPGTRVKALMAGQQFSDTLAHPEGLRALQRMIVRQHLADRELALEAAALLPQEHVVVLYEKGVLDAAAGMDRADFGDLLHSEGLSFDALRDSYSAVAHLATPDSYAAGSPLGRAPTLQEARRLDSAIRSVWAGHTRQVIVPAADTLSEKVDAAYAAVRAAVMTPLALEAAAPEAPARGSDAPDTEVWIGVFLGSRYGERPEYEAMATALGAEIARRGYGLVYGGACVGLMGALAKAAIAEGGRVVGVLPHTLLDREGRLAGLEDLRLVDTMEERKRLMGELSTAFISMPGGYGTAEEMFQMVTATQLRFHDKPMVVLNVAGFYDDLIRHLDRCTREGFIDPAHRRIVDEARDAREAVDRIEASLGIGQTIELKGRPAEGHDLG